MAKYLQSCFLSRTFIVFSTMRLGSVVADWRMFDDVNERFYDFHFLKYTEAMEIDR